LSQKRTFLIHFFSYLKQHTGNVWEHYLFLTVSPS
jgi:hypothetical protein